jgi:outer membrane protein TolC
MFRSRIAIGLVLTVGLLPGCRSYNGEEIRREHAESFPRQLAEKSGRVLADDSVLGLNDCIALAMEHSLDVRCADIQQRVAKLNKQVSFAKFLPAVRLGVDHAWFDPNPQVRLAGGPGVSLHDSYFRDVTWNIELALFNPATWNLYAMHARGYEIAELVNKYTRQAIAFQVTSFYFQVLSLEKMVETAEVYVTAAENLDRELQAMQQEGLVAPWQADQGRLLVLQRRSALQQVRRSLGQIRSELLVAMGLSPQTEIHLKMALPLAMPTGTLSDVMAEALISHPSLAIADRQVAIDHEEVKLAFASFLPQVMGFAQHLNTSDSQQVFANQWMGGISGVMTVFNGFANINQYKAAKQEREDAYIQREQSTLTLMIQVIRAWDQVQTAREQITLAELAGRVADSRLSELKQKHAQGLVQPSDLLSLVAENHQTHSQVLLAQVQYQTSVAMLLNVMGKTPIDFEESVDDAS